MSQNLSATISVKFESGTHKVIKAFEKKNKQPENSLGGYYMEAG